MGPGTRILLIPAFPWVCEGGLSASSRPACPAAGLHRVARPAGGRIVLLSPAPEPDPQSHAQMNPQLFQISWLLRALREVGAVAVGPSPGCARRSLRPSDSPCHHPSPTLFPPLSQGPLVPLTLCSRHQMGLASVALVVVLRLPNMCADSLTCLPKVLDTLYLEISIDSQDIAKITQRGLGTLYTGFPRW